MKHLVVFAAAQIVLGSLWAQDTVVSTRVVSEPCGQFLVDGVMYQRSAVFLWPLNSKHILSIGPGYLISDDIQCSPTATPLDVTTSSCQESWQKICAPDVPPCRAAPVAPCAAVGSWVDSNGNAVPGGSTVVVTASTNISGYRTDSALFYRVSIIAGDLNGAMQFSCAQDSGPNFGKLFVNGTCYAQSAAIWLPLGAPMTVLAVPPKGFVFAGWQGGPLGGISNASGSFVLLGPVTIRPLFTPAILVTLRTIPEGMKVLADRTVVPTPVTLEWGQSTTHLLSSVTPQWDSTGNLWAWDSWSQGGDETQIVRMPDGAASLTYTATYAPAQTVSFTSSPIGLKLVIDGRDNWPLYNFTWKVGSKHTISAPQQQTGADGRQYVFNSWSTPGGADQIFTVTGGDPVGALAKYDLLGRLTVQSIPGDVNVLVNGTACKTPCVIDRMPGTLVTVLPPATVSLTDTMRLDFTAWADGTSERERNLTIGTDALRLVVMYQSSNRVQAVSDPAGGATFRFDPTSTDGFYPVDTNVTVTADPAPGYKFKWWEGDASGTSRVVQVRTTLPVYLRAILDRVPFVAPTGVRNAAGDGPGPVAVAPGSLISIYGGALAPGFEKGPDSPLAQTLSNVTVQVADRILPLLFVSPQQINAQLLSDLPEGQYKVLVKGDTQPDASANFTVRRNAPGLFTQTIDDKQYALALHADGTTITPTAAAQRGETVTLLGTGLGPYKEYPSDGFAIPENTVLHLADAVQIVAGDKTITPTETVAAVGYVGVTAVRFKVGDELPAGADAQLKIVVNQRESNTVVLPVK